MNSSVCVHSVKSISIFPTDDIGGTYTRKILVHGNDDTTYELTCFSDDKPSLEVNVKQEYKI